MTWPEFMKKFDKGELGDDAVWFDWYALALGAKDWDDTKKKSQKPSELLNIYSEKLSQGIETKLSPLTFGLSFKYRSPHTAYISGYVIFRTNWILEFDEILRQEKVKSKNSNIVTI
jgi:hypothetical protein